MARRRFEVGGCADLGAFDPRAPDAGAGEFLDRAHGILDWIVLMEDRQPDFFHGYSGYEAGARAPLNRHGPRGEAWTHADLKRLVAGLKDAGVAPFLGYWVHECDWVDEKHPELLLRDSGGTLWRDRELQNADFNPMRRLRADPASGIEEGEPYHAWAARRFNRIADDFGFDGLFLGDGAMGFRRHGEDHRDLRHFDYDDAWLDEFRDFAGFVPHRGCALERPREGTGAKAKDVRRHHWDAWVSWNGDRWTAYYRDTARAVHAAGRSLAAYNVMNYDPALARLHGVSYQGIAEAGLDKLVFQAYDYAWGPLGPFAWAGIRRKDHATNLRALLLTRAHMGFDASTRLLFTTETDDSVERWDSPDPHTLGQAYDLGNATAFDGEAWRRAADGTFVVWTNAIRRAEWRSLAACFGTFEAEPAAPSSALVWRDGDEHALVARALALATPEERYAHLDGWSESHDGPVSAAIHERDLPRARWAAHPRRVPVHSRAGKPAPAAAPSSGEPADGVRS